MSILKKTFFAALAAITFASAGTALTANSAEAHGYNYSNYSCYYKQVWKKNYYGHGRWVTVKVCK